MSNGTGKKSKDARSSKLPVWVSVLAVLVVAPLGLARFVIRSFNTPAGSMAPTLLVGDRFFVRLAGAEAPPRAEVIVFDFPENRAQSFVKRVIALPGQRLEVINGRPILDGVLTPRCYVGPLPHEGRTSELYVEFLGGHAYGTIFDEKQEERACSSDADCGDGLRCRASICGRVQGPFQVKPGEVWVLGDNRDNSHDSRSWFGGLGGGVPFDHITGRALTIWTSTTPGRAMTAVHGPPLLPPEAASLQPALDKCLRDRPKSR